MLTIYQYNFFSIKFFWVLKKLFAFTHYCLYMVKNFKLYVVKKYENQRFHQRVEKFCTPLYIYIHTNEHNTMSEHHATPTFVASALITQHMALCFVELEEISTIFRETIACRHHVGKSKVPLKQLANHDTIVSRGVRGFSLCREAQAFRFS